MSNYNISNDALTQELQRIGALITSNRLQEAAKSLNDVRKRYSSDARIYLLASRVAERAGNAEGALQSAQLAKAAAPGWPVAVMELTLLLLRQGKPAEALAQAKEAMSLASDDFMVVSRCVGTAIQARDLPLTVAWLRTALELRPDDSMLRTLLAQQLIPAGEFEEAYGIFDELVQEQPWDTEVLTGRARAALKLGKNEQAQRDAEALLRLEPGSPKHQCLLALARGEQPKTQPAEDVKALFDGFAETFDVTLWRGLEYRVPQLAADILLKAYPDRKFNVLDLGCGTGLVGVCLGQLDGFIIGVDLSEEMIRKAMRHNVYARFHNVNMLDALRDTPSDHYEAITCCDALIYVGDLTDVIPNALRILKPEGYFVFSCEAAAEDEPDMVLRPSNRFAHKASAVKQMCEQAGFESVQIEPLAQLRSESGEPLPGFLVTARKAAAGSKQN